jgi:dihydrofolate reductase
MGKDNDLLWHLPNDFKSSNHLPLDIIYGKKKTFESFQNHYLIELTLSSPDKRIQSRRMYNCG